MFKFEIIMMSSFDSKVIALCRQLLDEYARCLREPTIVEKKLYWNSVLENINMRIEFWHEQDNSENVKLYLCRKQAWLALKKYGPNYLKKKLQRLESKGVSG
jgi:hypothetical protein